MTTQTETKKPYVLVLQPHLSSEIPESLLVVTSFGPRLMASTPHGPAEDLLRRSERLPHETIDQASHFRNGYWQESSVESPFFSASSRARMRTTARYARASIASVICRYQPIQ
jgi:hypothetical protein